MKKLPEIYQKFLKDYLFVTKSYSEILHHKTFSKLRRTPLARKYEKNWTHSQNQKSKIVQ